MYEAIVNILNSYQSSTNPEVTTDTFIESITTFTFVSTLLINITILEKIKVLSD